MRVRAAIIVPKTIVQKGDWKVVTGASRMPKSAFPIGNDNPVTFARKWHWRVDHLASADGTAFRLLTAYNAPIEECRAWLALDFGKSAVLLARFEFHGTHEGWHCHAPCDEIVQGDQGALRTRDVLRFPEGKGFHRKMDFGITSNEHATAKSFGFYRVSAEKGELL